jgi:hypothetical protein
VCDQLMAGSALACNMERLADQAGAESSVSDGIHLPDVPVQSCVPGVVVRAPRRCRVLPGRGGFGAARSTLNRKTGVLKRTADVVFRYKRAVLDADRAGFRRYIDVIDPRELVDDVDEVGNVIRAFDARRNDDSGVHGAISSQYPVFGGAPPVRDAGGG